MDVISETIFMEFRYLLKHHIAGIFLKENLRDKKTREPLAGRVIFGRRIIYIEKNLSEEEKLCTLIHELAHILFWNMPEKQILKLENALRWSFTKYQIGNLKKYIPKCRHKIHSLKH